MITVLSVNIGWLVGGTVVIERVFAIPGIGGLMLDAIGNRDFAVVQAITLVFAVFVIFVYLVADVSYSLIDPRVRSLSAVAPDSAAQTLSPDLLPLPVGGRQGRVQDALVPQQVLRRRARHPRRDHRPVHVRAAPDPLQPHPAGPDARAAAALGASIWLGTDQLGIDMWSQLLYGGRTDLRIAFLAVILPFILGTTLGCLAGYYGRAVDIGVMRAVDVVVAFPFYVLVIALVFALGPGERGIYIAITIVGWVSYARIVRGEILVAKQQDYVLAARSAGFGAPRIIVRHLLPNVITQAIVFATADVVLDILAIVTLGYLGLGVPPPTPDWGRMIFNGQQFLTTQWQLATFPGLAVVITGVGLALLGDGLSDLLRPE